jgi:transposase-like protein
MGGKQNHICVDCGPQFLAVYTAPSGFSDAMKTLSLKMDFNSMEFPGIERVIAVAHTSVISLVKQVGENLPDAYEPECIPEVGELE